MRVSPQGRSHQLQLYGVGSELTREVTVDPTGYQPGISEDPAVLRLTAMVPSVEVSLHVVARGVGLQKRDACEETGDVTQATFHRQVGHVLENVGADDQVVAT